VTVTVKSRSPREEGFSKDADKLIRRLSLVALLLSRQGQPVSAHEIRERVEGYPSMTTEAFKRRFYEDRAELAALGIEISSEADPQTAGELYSLPPTAYYLTPVDLTREELLALATCLVVLEQRFAYSRPLRLALVSLAQGRPELLADAATPPLTVLPDDEPPSAAAALPKLQAAIAERKTVRFSYYAISRDEERERVVDPYGLQLVGDEWYVIGRCHLRDALRTFRLSRVRSRVTYASRAPHDFARPVDFDLAAYRDRPAWQLGPAREVARIAVAPSMAWWVEAHFAQSGEIEASEGGVVFVTRYAAARPLISWVLGLGGAAELLEPAELRRELVEQLHGLRSLLDEPFASTPATADGGSAPPAPAPARAGRTRRRGDDWRIEVDRFTRLTALTTYLLRHCGPDGEGVVHVEQVCRDLDVTSAELRADVRLLNLVNFGADGSLLFAEFASRGRLNVICDLAADAFQRAARLSPLQADTLLLAVELVGGQLPAEPGAALQSAAEKLRRARRDPATVAAGDRLGGQDAVYGAVNVAIKERRLLDIEYWAEGSGEIRRRTVEPYLLVRGRGEWYYVAWCRAVDGRRVFRVATTKRATVLDERFAPRSDIELDLYRREGIPSSAAYAPRTAEVWYSPQVARWIEERQTLRRLPDGAGVATQPYVDPGWLTQTLLRFSGQARPLSPSEAVDDLRTAVDRILAMHEGAGS
jgi:proteasome accessory factor C